MKAGIVVDDWKLPVFRKRLDEAGFAYEDLGPTTVDTTALSVLFEPADLAKLTAIVAGANAECARTKR